MKLVNNRIALLSNIFNTISLTFKKPSRSFFTVPIFDPKTQRKEGISYVEERLIGYTPNQIFNVVANVNHYKLFLPHVKDSQILSHKNNSGEMEAQLTVGFPPFYESFISRIHYNCPHYVRAESKSGKLFDHLCNIWELTPVYPSQIKQMHHHHHSHHHGHPHQHSPHHQHHASNSGVNASPNNVNQTANGNGIATNRTTVQQNVPIDVQDQTMKPHATKLKFLVEFEFSNIWYQTVANMFFEFLVGTMTDAFEKRCRELYGPPSIPTQKLYAQQMPLNQFRQRKSSSQQQKMSAV